MLSEDLKSSFSVSWNGDSSSGGIDNLAYEMDLMFGSLSGSMNLDSLCIDVEALRGESDFVQQGRCWEFIAGLSALVC